MKNQSPFLDVKSFATEEAELQEVGVRASPPVRSPFLAVYELEDGESSYDDPVREAYSALVDELYDEEFDEALFELEVHGRALHDEQMTDGSSRMEADRLVTQHFSQLVRESEAMVDAMAREFGSRDETSIVDREVESFVERYSPSATLDPEFENFFGKLFKKIGSVVKTAARKGWQVVKKIGLGPIFNKLKALIKPLVNNVLQKATGKLPEAVQPAAQILAQKLGFSTPKPSEPALGGTNDSNLPIPTPEGVGSPVQDTVSENFASVQQEFNEQIAGAFLAQDEVELNLEVARMRSSSSVAASPVFADLDDAREQFIHELDQLKDGEDPEPYIQNFLPVVLNVLRVAIPIIGRPRVVKFLAGLLAKLIGKLIGPTYAPALSMAIVDSGLRLLKLEMSEEEKSGLAASAVAATVEETISRVASLPEYVLDNQELLEGFALEAFEQAAAANLPAVFSAEIYRQRPELLEGGVNAGWLLMPLRGPKRYKRCSRSFKVKITPHMAEEIEGFEGVPLAEYLQDQLGLPEGAEVEAEVHLYETLPGTTVADIARSESETPGLGASDEAAYAQLLPLTPRVASALLGRPGLGRNLSSSADSRNVAAGQRLYHLAIPGKRPLTIPGVAKRRRVRRLGHIHVTLDGTQDQIRVLVHISEVKAQKLAVRLRQQSNIGSISVGFHKLLTRRLGPILQGQRPRRLRIVHAGMRPGLAPATALQNLPTLIPPVFITKMREWLMHGFAGFMKTQANQFITATEDPADGVTLRFTIEHPQGLKELCQALIEKGPSGSKVAELIGTGSRPNVRVEVYPRH